MLCTRVYPLYTSTVRVEKTRERLITLAKRLPQEPHLANKLEETRNKLDRLAREDGVLLPPGLT
jgi:hypothetical protein